ncbi:peptidoglycan-binding domain-containing protein [Catellatospora sichuanensis]|uniref:peptidoglycan-binding domain-containing protein n=1 Tax=Catellatospora sichuanensis TaxID=1969805 RepID=UPI001181DBA6|nr:peptidoglycan-binding domain-containing protein [Catellatospora sichuanensis]
MATPTPNPSPAYITNEMWAAWLAFKAMEPKATLSGIYANKKGYHNTRKANRANWPGNYSYAQFAADQSGPDDKAAAFDFSLPPAEMVKYSGRLLRAGQDPNDERTNYFREFYGQADADSAVEGWDFARNAAATSDSSHLWHIHISVHRMYVNSAKAMRALLSILRGESVVVWRAAEAALAGPVPPKPSKPAPPWKPPATVKKGAKGALVRTLQTRLNVFGHKLRVDGDFGNLTQIAVKRFQKAKKLTVDGIVGPKTWAKLYNR